jgi:hypothetical protein
LLSGWSSLPLRVITASVATMAATTVSQDTGVPPLQASLLLLPGFLIRSLPRLRVSVYLLPPEHFLRIILNNNPNSVDEILSYLHSKILLV